MTNLCDSGSGDKSSYVRQCLYLHYFTTPECRMPTFLHRLQWIFTITCYSLNHNYVSLCTVLLTYKALVCRWLSYFDRVSVAQNVPSFNDKWLSAEYFMHIPDNNHNVNKSKDSFSTVCKCFTFIKIKLLNNFLLDATDPVGLTCKTISSKNIDPQV